MEALVRVNAGIGQWGLNGGIEKDEWGHWKVNGGIEKSQWGHWSGSMVQLKRVNGGVGQGQWGY